MIHFNYVISIADLSNLRICDITAPRGQTISCNSNSYWMHTGQPAVRWANNAEQPQLSHRRSFNATWKALNRLCHYWWSLV